MRGGRWIFRQCSSRVACPAVLARGHVSMQARPLDEIRDYSQSIALLTHWTNATRMIVIHVPAKLCTESNNASRCSYNKTQQYLLLITWKKKKKKKRSAISIELSYSLKRIYLHLQAPHQDLWTINITGVLLKSDKTHVFRNLQSTGKTERYICHILNSKNLGNFTKNHVSKRRLCAPISACLLLFVLSETNVEIVWKARLRLLLCLKQHWLREEGIGCGKWYFIH